MNRPLTSIGLAILAAAVLFVIAAATIGTLP